LLVDGDSGQHDFDCLVLATGFRTQDFLYPIKIYGLGGRSSEDIWREAGGPQAYLGVTVNSLPNFAMLYGPNTNLGHNSIILTGFIIHASHNAIFSLILGHILIPCSFNAFCFPGSFLLSSPC
jgi:cation diffusion facilitator CzcD-associated flavoprotein CzcO